MDSETRAQAWDDLRAHMSVVLAEPGFAATAAIDAFKEAGWTLLPPSEHIRYVKPDGEVGELPSEHYVTWDHDGGWFIEHSLDCRIAGMRHCKINRLIAERIADRHGSIPAGRYRVEWHDTGTEDGAITIEPVAEGDHA